MEASKRGADIIFHAAGQMDIYSSYSNSTSF